MIPDGYVRDKAGRWRYADGGDLVPGARDLTLRRLWSFARDGDELLVPETLAFAEETLAWCTEVHTGIDTHRSGRSGPFISVLRVPLEAWDDRAGEPLGIDAPELAPSRLIGVARVAELAGECKPATVRAYVARGILPRPVLPAPVGPAWSLPVVLRRLERRPGQGRPGPVRVQRPAPHNATNPPKFDGFADSMAHLDRLMHRS